MKKDVKIVPVVTSPDVIHCSDLTPSEEERILRFFKDLAPENEKIIDLPLIINEGFPVFEETIGAFNWKKIKKFYGIGVKNPSKTIKSAEIAVLVSKLRTFENAQFYLYGFKSLLNTVSKKLCNAPEETDVVTKCKILRLYAFIFKDSHFFMDDYAYDSITQKALISPAMILYNNSRKVVPEEFDFLWQSAFVAYPDSSILYDVIVESLLKLSKRDLKEILDFSELNLTNGIFTSINVSKNVTFGDLRSLKYRIYPEPAVISNDLYFSVDTQDTLEFGEMYTVYKALKTKNLKKDFPTSELKYLCVDGSNIINKPYTVYQVAKDVPISGQAEADRFIEFIESCAKNHREFPIDIIFVNPDKKASEIDLKKAQKYRTNVDVGEFFTFLSFAKEMGYVDSKTNVTTDYVRYLAFMDLEKASNYLQMFADGEITASELKNLAGIDKKFEEDELGIEKPINILEVAKDFAVAQSYISSKEDVPDKFISEVLLNGNENLWEKYAKAKSKSPEELMEALKIPADLEEMFFSPEAVDVSILEDILLDIKASRFSNSMKNYIPIIRLYCFVIDNKVKCGPKGKVPKGNKRLKTSNLKKLAGIA